jgi:hypothetical protein
LHVPLALRVPLVLLVSALTLGGLAACDGDSETEIVSYLDAAGRSCTVDLFDIRGVATCDVDPATVVDCTEGNVAVFTHSPDRSPPDGTGALRNCGGCLNEAERTTYIDSPSCSPITCSSDEDCLFDSYGCSSGICTRIEP